jgi:Eukaryotic protein of unknown function (DUF846)
MHDLQFDVQNGDGRPQERPRAGELSHLPDHFSQAARNAGGTTNGTTTAPATTGGLEFISTQLKQSSHPNVIIFHLLFKSLAFFLYFFGNWFGKSGSRFITLTVICILLLAADFWVVKNVTGRLLVGLRWWNKVEDDDTLWIFESAEDKVVNKFDRTVFWTVLYATPVLWAAFFLLGVLKWSIQWLLIDILALSMSLANVYGYYRCSKEQASQFQQFMQAGAQQGAAAMIRSNMLTMLTGTNTNSRSSNGFGP